MSASAESEDKRPASRRVADDLIARIEADEFAPGASLPPYRQLADHYDVAVNTAIAAVKLVRDAGLVTIKRHVGAQVRDRTEDVDVAGEINAVRQAVVGLRVEVDRVSAELADLEARLAMLAERSGSDTT